MTYKDFPLWLEGIFDANPNGLSVEQMNVIRAKMQTLTFPKEPPKPLGPGINPPGKHMLRC